MYKGPVQTFVGKRWERASVPFKSGVRSTQQKERIDNDVKHMSVPSTGITTRHGHHDDEVKEPSGVEDDARRRVGERIGVYK